MRPHRKIQGTGDEYRLGPSGLTVNAVPIANSIEIAPEKKAGKNHLHGLEPDPRCERERALLGAVILGWWTVEAVDDAIMQLEHRCLLDALRSVDLGALGPEQRLANAVEWCRAVGVDSVLCGRVDRAHSPPLSMGYLAGCARSARLLNLERDAPAAPVAPIAIDEDDAENWER